MQDAWTYIYDCICIALCYCVCKRVCSGDCLLACGFLFESAVDERTVCARNRGWVLVCYSYITYVWMCVSVCWAVYMPSLVWACVCMSVYVCLVSGVWVCIWCVGCKSQQTPQCVDAYLPRIVVARSSEGPSPDIITILMISNTWIQLVRFFGSCLKCTNTVWLVREGGVATEAGNTPTESEMPSKAESLWMEQLPLVFAAVGAVITTVASSGLLCFLCGATGVRMMARRLVVLTWWSNNGQPMATASGKRRYRRCCTTIAAAAEEHAKLYIGYRPNPITVKAVKYMLSYTICHT